MSSSLNVKTIVVDSLSNCMHLHKVKGYMKDLDLLM